MSTGNTYWRRYFCFQDFAPAIGMYFHDLALLQTSDWHMIPGIFGLYIGRSLFQRQPQLPPYLCSLVVGRVISEASHCCSCFLRIFESKKLPAFPTTE